MPWTEYDTRPYLRRGMEPRLTTPLRTNATCFMRRQHKCEKVFGASKSCFVACPTDESLKPLLALLEAKLAAHGIESVVAVEQRAYGQDIVCTKICGRIIESRFCVAVLDETDRDGVRVANPNVYYEYGLMTALRKHVIPLQREGMVLAFNIQSQDTVKYSDSNMADEIERAIRDAIAQTEPGHESKLADAPVTARGILRRLELAGYVPAQRNAAANGTTDDTLFMTLVSESAGYLFLAKVDDERDAGVFLDDLPVLVYRLQDLRRRTEAELEELPAMLESVSAKLEKARADGPRGSGPRAFDLERELRDLEPRGPMLKRRIEQLDAAHLGFVANPDVDAARLQNVTEKALNDTHILPLWNEGTTLQIAELVVDYGRQWDAPALDESQM